jgi:4-amino-4-deoxy-L-arabinose transferase-like glycosyltransferase
MPPLQQRTHYNWLYFFIGLAVLINFSGLFVPLMDPDAGVFASVTKNMLLSNNWTDLHFQGKDWLDKPHFPFWITAIFFKLFGMHTWSYKLPGILFVLMGAWYTYLFAKKFYGRDVALWSVFILLTAEHILISNNDVRAEPFLTGLIIASLYHFSCSLKRGVSWHLVAASFFAGCAMMTKGLFTLIPIGVGLGGHLLLTQQWKQLFHWRWLLALILLLLFISPELYALWYQFDSHPEKIVFGRDHVSGIKFFLWDSQFGRFMNTGPIKGKGDPSFFLVTLIWAFLPWCFLMYMALYKKIKAAFDKNKRLGGEWYLLCGSLFTLLVFSVSKFQLPYYTNIIFPMLAILTAQVVTELIEKGNRSIAGVQTGICLLLLFIGAGLFVFYKPGFSPFSLVLVVGALLVFILMPVIMKNQSREIAYLRSGLCTLTIALFFNLIFYPDLLQYQSGNQMAFYVNNNFPDVTVGKMSFYMPSGEFYLDRPVLPVDTNTLKNNALKGGLLYISSEDKQLLDNAGIKYEIVKEFREYHITMLSLTFINSKTREKELKPFFLLRII